MEIVERLQSIWAGIDYPFLIHRGRELRFADIAGQETAPLDDVRAGDVVALIGDFNPISILTLLKLIDLETIVVPLTQETASQHEYFFDAASVDVVIENGETRRLSRDETHPLIEELRGGLMPGSGQPFLERPALAQLYLEHPMLPSPLA